MPKEPVSVQRIAAKAFICNAAGEVLILREAKTYAEGTNTGRYHLPGGRVNMGEPFLEALRREVDEETGLAVEIGRPFYAGEWFPNIKGVQNQIVDVFFACNAISDDVKLSDEHDEWLWIRPENYQRYDVMSPEDEVFEAFVSLKSPR